MHLHFSDDNRIFNIHTEGIPYLSFDRLDRLGVPNLFTTRFLSYDPETEQGRTGLRVAVMPFEDKREASRIVRANRETLARQLGTTLEMECITDQKHTNHVIVAAREDLGLRDKPPHMQNVDGIVTDMPDVVLTVFGGDCPSVFLADPVRRAIGLVHAGWKGTLGRIPEVAVQKMVQAFGCDPKDFVCAIGPGICQDCYEMGDEVYDLFAREWSREEADRIFARYPAIDPDGTPIPGGKYHLDLRAANRMTLLRAGIREEQITVANLCTMCNVETFYSYRAGRMENEQAAMLVNRFDAAP